ncbi:phosphotransferase family protein [Actinopolymorpha rutila]|nr:phosphotransferase [Actinopolymorpha rutila]
MPSGRRSVCQVTSPGSEALDLLERVAAHGVRLEPLGRGSGGEIGATLVRWPDGREGVLKSITHRSFSEVQRTADVLEMARGHGLPVPLYERVLDLGGSVAIVQERLPGTPPLVVDRGLLEALVALNERFAGLLADRLDVPAPRLYLQESGPGYCLHESLAGYDRRSRRLLSWIREVGRDSPAVVAGADLVHPDLHPGNALVDGYRLCGLVDWDELARGDRRFALVVLRFNAGWEGWDAALISWLDALLAEVLDPESFRIYWAHKSLAAVDWAIRRHTRQDVERRLAVAESHLS